jgi:hypothetical protein
MVFYVFLGLLGSLLSSMMRAISSPVLLKGPPFSATAVYPDPTIVDEVPIPRGLPQPNFTTSNLLSLLMSVLNRLAKPTWHPLHVESALNLLIRYPNFSFAMPLTLDSHSATFPCRALFKVDVF